MVSQRAWQLGNAPHAMVGAQRAREPTEGEKYAGELNWHMCVCACVCIYIFDVRGIQSLKNCYRFKTKAITEISLIVCFVLL